MQTTVTDDRGVCPSVCQSVRKSVCHAARLNCAKTAEQIKIPFGVNTAGGPRNAVLDGGPDLPQLGKGIRRNLRQITLASCSSFDNLGPPFRSIFKLDDFT